jgi:hypothetical protein
MTFGDFVNRYSKTASVKLANNRNWPRPLSTTEKLDTFLSVAAAKAKSQLDTSHWLFSLSDDADE